MQKEVLENSKDVVNYAKEVLGKSMEEDEDVASEMDSNHHGNEKNLCHLQQNGSLLQIL